MNSHLILISMGLAGVLAGAESPKPCAAWAAGGGKCTSGGEMRDADDGHACSDNKCDEANCCGFKCGTYFKGTCGEKEEVFSGKRMYGSVGYRDGKGQWMQFKDKKIDWNLVGAGVQEGCCQKTCRSTAQATCTGGKVFSSRDCQMYKGETATVDNPTGLVDFCGEADPITKHGETFDGCCEKVTCMHSSCNLFNDITTSCTSHGANKCATECNDIKTKAQFDACAKCVNVPAAHKKCVDCLICYGSLNNIIVTDPRPAGEAAAAKAAAEVEAKKAAAAEAEANAKELADIAAKAGATPEQKAAAEAAAKAATKAKADVAVAEAAAQAQGSASMAASLAAPSVIYLLAVIFVTASH